MISLWLGFQTWNYKHKIMSHRLQHLQKKRVEQTQHYQQPQAENTQRPSSNPAQLSNQNVSQGSLRPIFPPTNIVQPFQRTDFQSGKRTFPPPESLYKSKEGQLDPAFLRSSCSVLHTLPRKTSLPIGLWISPFANDQVSAIDVRSPLRCARCKAYVNPYFQFDGARRAVTCNLCGLRFNIDESIDRANIDTPEVSSQLVLDFQVVDKFYMKKRTDIIKIFVALELSMATIQMGIVSTVISSLKSVFQSHQFEEKVRIGIVFFNDNGVGFLRKGEEGSDPTIFLVPNNKNGAFCCPLSDQQQLLDPNQQRQKIGSTFDFLQAYADSLWKTGKFSHQASYINAIKSIKECFEQQAGKIFLFSILDPKVGPCSIRPRNEQESKLPLKPLHLQTSELARELVRSRIGVEHFYFSKDNLIPHELPTTHFLSSLTGGQLHLYNGYNDNQSQHLYYNIFHAFTKPTYFDVDFTCRSSTGTNVLRYGIPEGLRESRDVGLSVITQSSSFTVQLDQQQKLEEHLGAFIQFALMYTTGSGQRRIRVINYKFEVSSRLDVVYDSVDYLTFANIVAKTYTYKLLKFDPAKPREDAIAWLRGITEQYRSRCQNLRFVKTGDISLPQKLAWAFSYLHVILNSKLFLSHIKITTDLRMYQYLKLHSSNPYFFATRYYPRVYPLTLDIYNEEPLPGDFIEDGQENEQDDTQKIAILPSNVALTKASFNDGGVYLHDAGDQLVIFIQSQASEQLLTELFGITKFEEIQESGLPELETSHNIRVNNIIAEIRRKSSLNGGMYQPLVIKTPLKKGPYGEALHNIQKEDYFDCKFPEFLDIIRRPVNVPK